MGLNSRFETADAAIAATLTDNSGGVASQTIAAITADVSVTNAIASLTAQINKLTVDNASMLAAINAGG